jgi:hypothetical protein
MADGKRPFMTYPHMTGKLPTILRIAVYQVASITTDAYTFFFSYFPFTLALSSCPPRVMLTTYALTHAQNPTCVLGPHTEGILQRV